MSTRPVRKAKVDPAAPRETRIPIRQKTAENLLALNRARDEAMRAVEAIENRIHDHLRPLYTEAGIEEGKCLEITEQAPHELVVVVTKSAPEA